MKKIKDMLVLSVLAMCAFAIVGMNKVNAAPYTIGNTAKIVCEPDQIAAGEGTDCYLVGKPEQTSGDYSLHGYVTYAFATDYLELKGVKANNNIPNTDAVFLKAASATDQLTAGGNMPNGLSGFVCEYDSANIETGMDFGCAIFYTIKDKTNAFTPESITKNNDKSILPNGKTTYGVIGSYQVSVSADAKGEECGELCVKAWNVPEESYYTRVKQCQAGANGCTETTAIQTINSGNNYVCREIHYAGNDGGVAPDTGAFASYTLLIAGALIAISAVTLAKKNTKFYRV